MQPELRDSIRVNQWSTERPLLALNAIVAAGLWALFALSPQSLPVVGIWLAFFTLMHMAFIAAVRGSGIRVGPDQFPELHDRVQQLAAAMGMHRVPDVYVMQQDGALNAFATRFLRSHMIVLLGDLLEACGDDVAARDMIIGHELGHIHAGHLRGYWLLMPAAFVPFLGSALSRAREFTCDRYGYAAAANHEGALLGLAILAGGARYGRRANRRALVQQRFDLRSAWMTVGEWLSSHPPLSKRLLALAPELDVPAPANGYDGRRALQVAFAGVVVIVVGGGALAAYLPRLRANYEVSASSRWEPPPDVERRVAQDLAELKAFIETERQKGGDLPWDVWDLYDRRNAAHPKRERLLDAFSGYWYDYESRGTAYRVWSLGPDQENDTADDIVLDSTPGASPRRRYSWRD